MRALRYVGLLAEVIWVGGLLVLGALAAPVIFEVLDAQPIANGRVLAGTVVGEIFRRFHLVSYACGAVLLLSLLTRAVLGPRPRFFGIRTGIAVVMLGSALYSGLVVSPRIAHASREIGVAPSRLPAADPRRAEFGRMHAQSTALQFVPLVGGLLLMFWDLKD